jgi:hypothetical protein
MEKGEAQASPFFLTKSAPICDESEPAQGTRSDRKVAKAVIHDMLGPRRPGAGRFPPLTVFPSR